MNVEYTLKLNSEQAQTLMKAVDLLMRLKLNQYDNIPYCLIGFNDEDYSNKREMSRNYLRMAFEVIFPTWEDIKKDDEWYRLYNLYKSVAYAKHCAENPNGKGVDSYPPTQLTDEPIPECTWERKENE